MIIGASARLLLLENIYGLPAGRRTLDWDFAIQVQDWSDYQGLRSALLAVDGFNATTIQTHRLRYQERIVLDIVPFGSGIENSQGIIEWPGEDIEMNVLTFNNLLASAIQVDLDDGLAVPVISAEGLFVAKLFAWRERRLQSPGKDAADIAYLLQHITHVVGEDVLFQKHMRIVEDADFELDIAAAQVFGGRVAEVLNTNTYQYLKQIFDQALSEGIDSALVSDLDRFGTESYV